MPKICDFENCRKYANYGDYYLKPLRCNEHKEEYKLVSKICQGDNCKIRSSFNFEGEKQSKFCNSHKENGMIIVVSKICEYQGCKTISNFNFLGERQGKFCSKHKEDGMIDIKHKICEFIGCKSQPAFNYPSETQIKFCGKHKLDDMINVKSKTCIEPLCKTVPIFNFSGNNIGLYCSLHKKENMIDIKNKYCLENNCKNQSNFNFENEKKGIYCSLHKKPNMININVDTCLFDGCKTIPSCNFLNKSKRLYCSKHKLDGMIDIMSKKCGYLGCETIPTFNFLGEITGKFCGSHKEEEMIDVKHDKCKANFCLGTRANIKYKGYCSNCYQNLFPLDPLSYQIRSKTKELCVRDYINSNFEGFQHDKPLFTGNCDCTNRRRIDHRILIGNTLLCIETDESQHKSYNKKDEEIRYDDLFMIHSGKFVFIRFNPDKYKNKDNKSVNPMLYTRLPILKEEIEKQMERIKNEENTELLEIIKLYYDDYN